MGLGTTWTCKIRVGDVEPTYFMEPVWWLRPKGVIVTATSGRFDGFTSTDKRREYELKLRVARRAVRQGPLSLPNAVEIDVLSDELGVFREAKQIFYGIFPSTSYATALIITLDPQSDNAIAALSDAYRNGFTAAFDGYALRFMYFAHAPGRQLSMKNEGVASVDTLHFVGIDRSARVTPAERLHYQRTVTPERVKGTPTEGNNLTAAFTEDIWFEKGKGLVELVQKRNGKTAMHWVLQSVH